MFLEHPVCRSYARPNRGSPGLWGWTADAPGLSIDLCYWRPDGPSSDASHEHGLHCCIPSLLSVFNTAVPLVAGASRHEMHLHCYAVVDTQDVWGHGFESGVRKIVPPTSYILGVQRSIMIDGQSTLNLIWVWGKWSHLDIILPPVLHTLDLWGTLLYPIYYIAAHWCAWWSIAVYTEEFNCQIQNSTPIGGLGEIERT